MGNVKIPYYVVKKGKYGYWQPTKAMQAAGFRPVRCGVDGPAAWGMAQEWNERWQRHRRGNEQQALPAFPRDSIGDGFERFRKTTVWSEKKPRTREDWERGWSRIKPVFGDLKPTSAAVNMENLSAFRNAVGAKVSVREAHRCIKIWRSLWNVLRAMGLTQGKDDPSLAFRNTLPAPRNARFVEGEAVRLCKQAWRLHYRGLAVAIAIAWDTQFSPVDLRQLTPARLKGKGKDRYFDIGRAKSGRDAFGTMSPRTLRMLDAYLEREPCEVGALLRNRSGAPYTRFTMPDDFRRICETILKGDKRNLADMRRSGALELLAGGAQPAAMAAKMANTIDTSNSLSATYQPVDLAAVRAADKARLAGRRKMRKGDE